MGVVVVRVLTPFRGAAPGVKEDSSSSDPIVAVRDRSGGDPSDSVSGNVFI